MVAEIQIVLSLTEEPSRQPPGLPTQAESRRDGLLRMHFVFSKRLEAVANGASGKRRRGRCERRMTKSRGRQCVSLCPGPPLISVGKGRAVSTQYPKVTRDAGEAWCGRPCRAPCSGGQGEGRVVLFWPGRRKGGTTLLLSVGFGCSPRGEERREETGGRQKIH
ncbi:hypothetical protein LX36DRAFT_269058 [Colletotrichum falcatum]|nr:hypothetical protein LX36DRAFT_269058 [Colletotrichum falcatum]